jgi:hypothetical protein
MSRTHFTKLSRQVPMVYVAISTPANQKATFVKEKTKFFDIKNFSATIYTSNIIANIRQA